MANLSFIIGIIGNIISILVFASPISTFIRVVKKKSTEDFNGLPYITTLLSTSLWTFYGLIKPGGLLVATVNGAGAVLQFIYVTLFLIYAPKDVKVKSIKLAAILDVGFLGSVMVVGLVAIHGHFRLIFIGVICSALTVGMYAAPLSSMRTVIKMKSVEYMPFSLSFFLFLNGGIWAVYALLVKDFFIGIPNAMGFVLGSFQLVLYTIYYKSKSPPTKSKEEEKEEEGSAQLVKRAIEMQGGGDDDEDEDTAINKNRSLHKGRSLPKPTVSRQISIDKIIRTISFNPYELQASTPHEYDLENGGNKKNHP
ncbi:hypothetical protein U1Q18_035768 [Sarracenia purpurea var. burkii]